MSKKFHIVSRKTGEQFVNTADKYVVLFDSGYPAFVAGDKWYKNVVAVDMSEWKLEVKKSWIEKLLKRD